MEETKEREELAKQKLGSTIKALRKSKKMTQTDLAHAIGGTQPWVANLESGRLMPTIQTLMKFSNALGVNLVIELRDENDKSS